MSIVVNTNVSSILVQRSLTTATKSIGQSLERLSTGYKINRAADDAAGLTISESLKAQGRGALMASQNAQIGVNLLQTAEGDLGIIQDNLQRVRDLSIQAANGTNGTEELSAIQSEVQQRVNEINRIASSSSFNAVKLLDGSNTTLSLHIGANFDANNISLNSITIGTPLAASSSTDLGVDDVDTYFATSSKAASYISLIDTAIATVSSNRSQIGSLQNRLDQAISSLQIKYENTSASESRIRDVDVAKEASTLTKNQILQQASASLLAQANQAPSVALSLI